MKIIGSFLTAGAFLCAVLFGSAVSASTKAGQASIQADWDAINRGIAAESGVEMFIQDSEHKAGQTSIQADWNAINREITTVLGMAGQEAERRAGQGAMKEDMNHFDKPEVHGYLGTHSTR